MSARSPQDQDKYVVRFPDGMRDRIREAAEANKRSMNAEIVARLESTFPRLGYAPHLPERIEPIEDAINRELVEFEESLRRLRLLTQQLEERD